MRSVCRRWVAVGASALGLVALLIAAPTAVGLNREPAAEFSRVAQDTPGMQGWQAHGYVRKALRRNFGDAYRFGSGKRRDCRRASRTMFRCKVSWFIGDGTYHGRIRVWHKRDRHGIAHWHYAFVIRHIDQYCRYVTPKRNCAETIVVK